MSITNRADSVNTKTPVFSPNLSLFIYGAYKLHKSVHFSAADVHKKPKSVKLSVKGENGKKKNRRDVSLRFFIFLRA